METTLKTSFSKKLFDKEDIEGEKDTLEMHNKSQRVPSEEVQYQGVHK